ncbi:MAG TPA: GNAT family N-acetyltransferase, partial [Acidimicrobiia bacterium]|nr:GNAT family N-acetyltransferase [Acidimicrobiia bacterium]
MTLDDMSFWPVQPFDPVTASDADLAGLHALDVALEAEALPGEPVAPLAHSLARYRHALPFEVRRGWVVRQGGASGQIVARAAVSYADVPENRHHADVWVGVHPAVRGLGIGSVLLQRAVDAARRWGCTVLDFEARVGGPGEPFLRSVAAERRLVERRSRCRTAAIDRALLEGWVRRAGERAPGYSLVAWDGPCPDELVAAFVTLKGVMNTAPLEALEWDEERLTVERWRQAESTFAARGVELWAVCARHDDSGELAGYTELALLGDWPEMAWQEDTGVWPKHRERGLGRWLKAVNALRLLDERPEVR